MCIEGSDRKLLIGSGWRGGDEEFRGTVVDFIEVAVRNAPEIMEFLIPNRVVDQPVAEVFTTVDGLAGHCGVCMDFFEGVEILEQIGRRFGGIMDRNLFWLFLGRFGGNLLGRRRCRGRVAVQAAPGRSGLDCGVGFGTDRGIKQAGCQRRDMTGRM